MSAISEEIHGIDEQTLGEYLAQLGGERQSSGEIRGPGWAARLTRLPDYRLGRAAFCCVRVEMEGDAAREVWSKFELRIMRPGG